MSNNLQRKLQRKSYVKEKKNANKELAGKMKGIFLPDECSNCNEPFDKKSKAMAMTWKVIANSERKHLICPKCWDAIEKIYPLDESLEDQPTQHQPQLHTEQVQKTQ